MATSNYTEDEDSTLKEKKYSKDKSDNGEFLRETIRKRIGERIYSRLREMCYFETLAGEDRRFEL